MSADNSAVEWTLSQFEPAPISGRLFMNSVPKSGTLLLRNIFLMFAGEQATHYPFMVDHDLGTHVEALGDPGKQFFTGHMNFNLQSLSTLRGMSHVLLVRDPYDYAMSYARFMMSPHFSVPIGDIAREQQFSLDDVLSIVINGLFEPENYFAPLGDIYRDNALKWIGQVYLVRYEDLTSAIANSDTVAAQDYLRTLLSACGFFDLPNDWMQRIHAGSDPAISSTASDAFEIPDEFRRPMPQWAKDRIELLYPNLRQSLGYASM